MHHKKIRLLIDADSAASSAKSGVGHYAHELIAALGRRNDVDIVTHSYAFLSSSKPNLPGEPNIHHRVSRLLPKQGINALRRLGISVPFELLIKAKGDFIIFPSFLSLPSLFGTPYTAAVHDMTFLDHPEFVSSRNQHDLARFVPRTLARASFLTTISSASLARIKHHYPWFHGETLISHIPAMPLAKLSDADSKQLLSSFDLAGNFILYLGTLEPRKNIQGIVDAYAALPADIRQSHALVLAGGKGWNDTALRSSIDELKRSGASVIEAGYVNDEQKSALLHSASVFVYPSFYEGYGIQLLEAMTARTPIVASDLPVFREVAGDAAVYCNPHDSQSIRDAIVDVLTDASLRQNLITAGDKRAGQLDWDSLANDMVTMIRNHLAGQVTN